MRSRLREAVATAVVTLLTANHAFAQAAGSVDISTSIHNTEVLGTLASGGAISAISAYQGVKAASHGQHIGPSIMGLIAGLVIAFGGAYIVSRVTGGMPV